jgi:pyridoxamine 5'-phosphate oxidase
MAASATPSEEEHLFLGDDPFILFARWFQDAKAGEANDPNGMTLATADGDGLPDARMVLMKEFDARGFVFYTNTESAKGRQLDANPKAALLFHWKSLRRQVRVRGPVSRVSDAEADAYFATRPRDSQIGAWVSDQSRPMEGRFVLEKRAAECALRFGIKPVPRPPHWTGYRVAPLRLEFWRDRAFRLHDRLVFERPVLDAPWTTSRLFP